MRKLLMVFAFLAAAGPAAAASSSWAVESSTLSYFADHKFHETRGVSHAARGKAVCGESGCDFLAAAPVNSFDSGDSNRDLHMLETVRGASSPMVTVKGSLPALPAGDFTVDLEISFAGRTALYKGVPFKASLNDGRFSFSGTVPATLKDFDIPPPSLLGIAIKDSIPVTVSLTWKKSS